MPTGSTYSIELDPLAHKIIPNESTYKILSTKIEIKLKKMMPGIMWGALESENDLGSKYYRCILFVMLTFCVYSNGNCVIQYKE